MVSVTAAGQPVQGPDEDESYTLDVAPAGARLTAPTVVGALRGLATLEQLVQADSAGFYLPAVHISDAPRFPWRGVLIDAGRHFVPPELIRRTLDGMAAVKLNVLHWHLSEDQGFRVESKRFPKLHGLGSDGQYYTQQELRDLVAYARDRGIRVVPEFDMPGHSTSWFVGYPEHASAPGPYAIERRFGVFPPAFDPTRESTYLFLEQFITEMTGIFPDPYWHIGGDEVMGKQWNENPRIAAYKRTHGMRTNEALQAHFNQRLPGSWPATTAAWWAGTRSSTRASPPAPWSSRGAAPNTWAARRARASTASSPRPGTWTTSRPPRTTTWPTRSPPAPRSRPTRRGTSWAARPACGPST